MLRKLLASEVLSLLWTALLILFLRWAVVEPFKIPSGSMIPTLLVGDFIFVAKSSYDLRLPFSDIRIVQIDDPKRGDVIVFGYPNNEKDPTKEGDYYIKRLVGLPGDRISVARGYPIVNGTEPRIEAVTDENRLGELPGFRFNSNNRLFLESFDSLSRPHWVQRYPYRGGGGLSDGGSEEAAPPCRPIGPHESESSQDFFRTFSVNEVCEFRVPEGNYFFMGDNRDDSADGRSWGFVPRKLLKGRALFTWFSCEGFESGSLTRDIGLCLSSIRWSRLGKSIR